MKIGLHNKYVLPLTIDETIVGKYLNSRNLVEGLSFLYVRKPTQNILQNKGLIFNTNDVIRVMFSALDQTTRTVL